MAAKELETTTIELADGAYELRASATKTLFDGFPRSTPRAATTARRTRRPSGPCRPSREGDATTVRDVTPTQHFTEPPPRFTEATLIKALEEHGIGRPSTYAATISTILDRGYVRVEERRLHPELIGEIVTDLLVEHFGDYVDLAFTARMEEELDEVARGERAWVPLLRAFYGPLAERVAEKRRELRRQRLHDGSRRDEVCSEGHPMVIRLGRNGRFLACSLFPEHKESRPLPGDEAPPQAGEGEVCPQCGEGTLVGKSGRFGPFVGCSRYPDCTYIKKEGPPPPDPLAVRGRLPEEQRRPPRLRVARGARGTSSGGAPTTRSATSRRTSSRSGRVHDADDGPVARARRDGHLPQVRRRRSRCRTGVELVGARLRGRPAEPRGAGQAGARRCATRASGWWRRLDRARRPRSCRRPLQRRIAPPAAERRCDAPNRNRARRVRSRPALRQVDREGRA